MQSSREFERPISDYRLGCPVTTATLELASDDAAADIIRRVGASVAGLAG